MLLSIEYQLKKQQQNDITLDPQQRQAREELQMEPWEKML